MVGYFWDQWKQCSNSLPNTSIRQLALATMCSISTSQVSSFMPSFFSSFISSFSIFFSLQLGVCCLPWHPQPPLCLCHCSLMPINLDFISSAFCSPTIPFRKSSPCCTRFLMFCPFTVQDSSSLRRTAMILSGVCSTVLILRKGCGWLTTASHLSQKSKSGHTAHLQRMPWMFCVEQESQVTLSCTTTDGWVGAEGLSFLGCLSSFICSRILLTISGIIFLSFSSMMACSSTFSFFSSSIFSSSTQMSSQFSMMTTCSVISPISKKSSLAASISTFALFAPDFSSTSRSYCERRAIWSPSWSRQESVQAEGRERKRAGSLAVMAGRVGVGRLMMWISEPRQNLSSIAV